MDKRPTESLYKVLVDSLFECKTAFTKEELKERIEMKEIEVKDVDLLIEFLREHYLIVLNSEGRYEVSVEYAFHKTYGKSGRDD